MNPLEQNIAEALKPILLELYQDDNPNISFQKTRKEFEGDVTLVVFPFVKKARKKPEQVAEEIGETLVSKVDMISAYQVVKGFLNLTISDEYWINFLNEIKSQDAFGFVPVTEDSEKVLVEYSSPNTNKPLHLGHIRNNLLGYAVSKVLEAAGKDVKKVQVINDRGIHICKSMLAWERFGNGETPESSGIKGDHLVGKYYVKFDQEYRKEIAELVEAGKSEDEAKKEAPIMIATKEMLVKWENNDPDTIALWEKMNNWVYDGFESTYKRLGVDFDKNYYESDTYILGRDHVLEGLEKGTFYKKEDGSVWCDLTDKKLDHKLVLRSDGTSVYMTQDIGTAIERHNDYGFNKMVYTVGDEQNYHFKVLFLILEKLGYSWAKDCAHLSYGMVDLPTGKMKSREGTVVDADDLMQSMFDEAKSRGTERGSYEGVDEQLQNELYEIIGMGALKYFILKVDPQKRMMFDPNESIEMQGNTAPFIQYAHARICSILRKYGEQHVDTTGVALDASAKEIIKKLYEFPFLIQQAANEYSPALVANYTYELVKEFNQFYLESPILNIEDEKLKQFRIDVCNKVGKTIKLGMSLLGITVPERM